MDYTTLYSPSPGLAHYSQYHGNDNDSFSIYTNKLIPCLPTPPTVRKPIFRDFAVDPMMSDMSAYGSHVNMPNTDSFVKICENDDTVYLDECQVKAEVEWAEDYIYEEMASSSSVYSSDAEMDEVSCDDTELDEEEDKMEETDMDEEQVHDTQCINSGHGLVSGTFGGKSKPKHVSFALDVDTENDIEDDIEDDNDHKEVFEVLKDIAEAPTKPPCFVPQSSGGKSLETLLKSVRPPSKPMYEMHSPPPSHRQKQSFSIHEDVSSGASSPLSSPSPPVIRIKFAKPDSLMDKASAVDAEQENGADRSSKARSVVQPQSCGTRETRRFVADQIAKIENETDDEEDALEDQKSIAKTCKPLRAITKAANNITERKPTPACIDKGSKKRTADDFDIKEEGDENLVPGRRKSVRLAVLAKNDSPRPVNLVREKPITPAFTPARNPKKKTESASSKAPEPNSKPRQITDPLPSEFKYRSFSSSIPLNPLFAKLYIRHPSPQDFCTPRANSSDWKGAVANPNIPADMDKDNLYITRWCKGNGVEKMGLCPICCVPESKGGAGKLVWLKTKISAFWYHMNYFHGINPSTGIPYSPPTAYRTVELPTASASAPIAKSGELGNFHLPDREEMLEGRCHQCKKWIRVQGIKDTDVKVPEIYWWKHAQKCHKTTVEGQGEEFWCYRNQFSQYVGLSRLTNDDSVRIRVFRSKSTATTAFIGGLRARRHTHGKTGAADAPPLPLPALKLENSGLELKRPSVPTLRIRISTMADSLILRGTLEGHAGDVTALATSAENPDVLLSASRDKSIIVWNLTRDEASYGVPKRSLHGHNSFVSDVVISSDGMYALSASWDKTLRLWDLNTGLTTKRFVGHTSDVLSVSFSADNLVEHPR
ncbi:hypothetical protein G7K_3948-t2 [Saitoella complicata NRRL Y-17804]|uniref:Transcription regulator Rua1 C-terminal domain-containing protein n=1 Tax=Saitoella complicata (strain BCRC 22490 / CBS 7301 / JCM 7358 / NBRC 10748 / NRRL Y-17804) TaxID=698492 RepID=A0A0E9NIY4_SAICN|nr:hypothetical protein G7K_3948-t2 [Saitoella complicata NRRL Y-17804]